MAVKSVLQNKKIRLVPIVKQGGMNPEGHDGEFMYSGTIVRFVVPFNIKKNRIENPLNEDERKFLEKELEHDLNIHKKEDNYWRKFEIIIRKDDSFMTTGIEIDLNDPVDFIKWKVLMIQPEVAPSWNERFDKGEYRFALIDDNEVVNEEAASVDAKEEAYAYLSKIKNSSKKMIDFLRVFGKRSPSNATVEYLKAEIGKIISDKHELNRMLTIIHDEDFDMRLFLEDAVECGAIVFSNRKYSLPGGDLINPNSPNAEGTIEKLKQLKEMTDEIYLTISTQIKESK